jgi:hypothetical protein
MSAVHDIVDRQPRLPSSSLSLVKIVPNAFKEVS